MPILYIPNDPLALGIAEIRTVSPHPDRDPGSCNFTIDLTVPAAEYSAGTREFVVWQCREAALRTLAILDLLHDEPLTAWQGGLSALTLNPNAGVDLNAYYDRSSLRFFNYPGKKRHYFSGASTDVVAHETGHALLDILRPDFWASNLFEVNAFHEAFGDCVALLVALHDDVTRAALLAKVDQANPVEATAEELSAGIREVYGPVNASEPRRARNDFQHALPTVLPRSGGPSVLLAEVHSFGQVFTGCFYDTIANIFTARGPGRTAEDLLDAAQIAGRLLIAAVREAPQEARFFREVGRAMVLADRQRHARANESAIRDAFGRHGVALSPGVAFAPEAALAGSTPPFESQAVLASVVEDELLERMHAAPGATTSFRTRALGTATIGEFTHTRQVPLDDVDPRLAGVVAMAPETVRLGTTGTRAMVLGAFPEAAKTEDEVKTFVESLLATGSIGFDAAGAQHGVVATDRPSSLTHEIRAEDGQRVLTRVRYACACGLPHAP